MNNTNHSLSQTISQTLKMSSRSDPAKLLSHIQQSASSEFSEALRSDGIALNVSEGKGK